MIANFLLVKKIRIILEKAVDRSEQIKGAEDNGFF